MKTVGIICEYNPFHAGHAHLLQCVRQADTVICLMSGTFVQRGEAAILPSRYRAEMALDEHLFPAAFDGTAKGCVNCAAGAQVKKVDAVVDRLGNDGLDLLRRRVLNSTHAQAQNAEFLVRRAMRQLSVFHNISSVIGWFNDVFIILLKADSKSSTNAFERGNVIVGIFPPSKNQYFYYMHYQS